jgi:hypothetical protein
LGPHLSSTTQLRPLRRRLSTAGIANLFIKKRHFEDKAITNELELSSGDPKTHPNIAESVKDQNKIPVEQTDFFVCAGGVNLSTLLRITRISLMEHAERELGANSVVDEQCVYPMCPFAPFIHCPFVIFRWQCTISGPMPVQSKKYKVQVWAMRSMTYAVS